MTSTEIIHIFREMVKSTALCGRSRTAILQELLPFIEMAISAGFSGSYIRNEILSITGLKIAPGTYRLILYRCRCRSIRTDILSSKEPPAAVSTQPQKAKETFTTTMRHETQTFDWDKLKNEKPEW